MTALPTLLRPPISRQHSRVPGGFDTDEELSPLKADFEDDPGTPEEWHAAATTKPSHAYDDSLLPAQPEDETKLVAADGSLLDEKEMHRRLLDVDSSFLPDYSPLPMQRTPRQENPLLSANRGDAVASLDTDGAYEPDTSVGIPHGERLETDKGSASPPTPSSMYKTPVPGRERGSPRTTATQSNTVNDYVNTPSLESMSSSPTAAAAARTISRAISNGSLGGYETADDQRQVTSLRSDALDGATDQEATPRNHSLHPSASSRGGSPTPTRSLALQDTDEAANGDIDDDHNAMRLRRRPRYISSRSTSHRSSYSSYTTTTSTEGGSDLTVGADYALQSGGAAPYGSLSSRPGMLSRSISLSSILSSDNEERPRIGANGDGNLSTLNEEDDAVGRSISSRTGEHSMRPVTPRANSRTLKTPTDTVIAQHVRDIQVPATMARDYRNRNLLSSPDKRHNVPASSVGRNSKNLTLKEQSGTIDRLTKENWDLKLKITFLNHALNQRSEEGVKAMISENVDLRTGKVKFEKEIRELKRSAKDLERKLHEREKSVLESPRNAKNVAEQAAQNIEEIEELEVEMSFLRERVATYEVDLEKFRQESFAKEGEKRRLAEIVKSFTEKRIDGSDPGVREELDMWKDLYESETARREQADEDNRKLREEIMRLKNDSLSTTTTNDYDTHHKHNSEKRNTTFDATSGTVSDYEHHRDGTTSAASGTLVEQLRHENAELRREVGAQTSMLTSRNREKERLYQEIEDLKLGTRHTGGGRSIAGDSIFERSASRAHIRPPSRTSDAATRITIMSDAERERYETKNGELRDQNSELRLKVQELTRQLDSLLDELEQFDAMKLDYENRMQTYENEISANTEDLQTMQSERDEALTLREELEAQFDDLKSEAQERINHLEDELEQGHQELQRLETEVTRRAEESDALRQEVRSVKEAFTRIEDDVRVKVSKIQDLEIENQEINHEMDVLTDQLHESNRKAEKLVVQLENSQNEINFLREEQDGDKIKIGDLEHDIKIRQASLESEKERFKDLEKRLTAERNQREVSGSEAQRMLNGLNREVTAAKEESRELQKGLQSWETEASTWKSRFSDLENGLRDVLGDWTGTKSSFLNSIRHLQEDLNSTASALDITKNSLSEKERIIRNRDALLESHGLESKKLSELLERERQGRRADKAQHEQWQKTHLHTSRTVSQKDVRITELESIKLQDRKRLAVLEQHLKADILERNNLLLALWNRISAMCGSDWQHQNSLVDGHLPTLDVLSGMLPGFSRNLLLAVKTVEGLIGGFRMKIRGVERDLSKQYQDLERDLDARIKKLDRLENTVQSQHVAGQFHAAPEIAKLRGENRLLKAELGNIQKQEMHVRASLRGSSTSIASPGSIDATTRAALSSTLMRHHSSSAVERGINPTAPAPVPQSAPIEPSQQRWIHRLKELERRLKAEREARLLDRSGARKRLEEGQIENEQLKMELERERVRRANSKAS